jgi:hypothetical protein
MVVQLLMLLILSPVFALIGATVMYRPSRSRVPAWAYALILLVTAVGGYFVGMIGGIDVACAPPAGNLCGLDGIFVSGPLTSSAAILLAGFFVSRAT